MRPITVLFAVVLLLAGCTSTSSDDEPSPSVATPLPTTAPAAADLLCGMVSKSAVKTVFDREVSGSGNANNRNPDGSVSTGSCTVTSDGQSVLYLQLAAGDAARVAEVRKDAADAGGEKLLPSGATGVVDANGGQLLVGSDPALNQVLYLTYSAKPVAGRDARADVAALLLQTAAALKLPLTS